MSRDRRVPTGDSTSLLVPAVGYLRQYGSMTCRQFTKAREQLLAFAEQHGLELRDVFVEELRSDPAAFEKLVQVVTQQNIRRVLVPNRAHLSSVGSGETKDLRLRRETGAEVLVADKYGPIEQGRDHNTTTVPAARGKSGQ
jgi:hypothetical protein